MIPSDQAAKFQRIEKIKMVDLSVNRETRDTGGADNWIMDERRAAGELLNANSHVHSAGYVNRIEMVTVTDLDVVISVHLGSSPMTMFPCS